MRARDVARPVTTVTPDNTALDAARLIVAGEGVSVLVVDDAGRPLAVLPGSQLVGFALPRYVRDDPSLAGVLDEAAAEAMAGRLAALTIGTILGDPDPDAHPRVDADAKLVEVAAVMAAAKVGMVPVVDDAGAVTGVITAPMLMAALSITS